MKCIRKISSLFLAVVMLASLSANVAMAVEESALRKTFNAVSDTEFDIFLVDYVEENLKHKSFEQIQADLKGIGIDITRSTDLSPRYIGANTVNLTIYITSRGDGKVWLISSAKYSNMEGYPAGYDALSIEWESSKASYYDCPSDNDIVTYQDGSQRQNGLVLFNIDDYKIGSGDIAVASVRVVPTSTGKGKWMEVGTKILHTYGTNTYNWSLGSTLSLSKGVTFSFNVNSNYAVDTWSKYATNAVLLP